MRTPTALPLFLLLLAACDRRPQPSADMTNETARDAIERLKEETEAIPGLDSLPQEQVKVITEKAREREAVIIEQFNASPFKDKSDTEIEAMFEEFLKEYATTRSAETERRIVDAMRDPLVKGYYDKLENNAKRKAIVNRLKELKAGGAQVP